MLPAVLGAPLVKRTDESERQKQWCTIRTSCEASESRVVLRRNEEFGCVPLVLPVSSLRTALLSGSDFRRFFEAVRIPVTIEGVLPALIHSAHRFGVE